MSKNSYFVDDGWAVWVDGNDTSTIYINDWINPNKRNYIDIAIHTYGIKKTNSLSIYIPFPVSKEEIVDISFLLQRKDILYATFNDACVIDYQKNECTSEIAYHGKTIDLVHISKLDYTLEPLADGTLFHLDFAGLHPYLANDEAYFAFRIPHKSLDGIFLKKINVQNFIKRLRELITTPVIDEKYGYSVRINESRLLPEEINSVGAFHRQKLKRTVISVAINDEYTPNDQGCYRIRRLEEALYREYVPEGFSCEDVIIYQWDQTRERNLRAHFNFYFSIMRSTISWASMVIYLVLIVFIGGFGSALWDLIKLLSRL